MKKNHTFRKMANRAIYSILTAMGFYSIPAQAENAMVEPSDDSPFNTDIVGEEWQNATEYGCPSASFIFRGKAIDQNNNPLAGIDVVVKMCEDTVMGIQTDEKGEFNLEYTDLPWCDVTLSFTKDAKTVKDTTILRGELSFVEPSGHWNYGTYSRTVTVVFPTDETAPTITFYEGALASIVDMEEPMFYITNLVDDYVWLSFRSVKSAQVALYSMEGTLQKEILLNDGEHLYVGDLKPGRYIMTAHSGSKKYAAIFVKR